MNGWCRICKEKDPEYVAPTTEPILQNQTTTTASADNAPVDGGMLDTVDKGEGTPWVMIAIVAVMVCAIGVMFVVLLKKKK